MNKGLFGAVALTVAAALLSAPLAGCSKQADDGLNPKQRQTADRLDDVAKKSDGNWNKLTSADKDFFIKTAGDENGARMLLLAKSGKLGYHGGGPPPGPPSSKR